MWRWVNSQLTPQYGRAQRGWSHSLGSRLRISGAILGGVAQEGWEKSWKRGCPSCATWDSSACSMMGSVVREAGGQAMAAMPSSPAATVYSAVPRSHCSTSASACSLPAHVLLVPITASRQSCHALPRIPRAGESQALQDLAEHAAGSRLGDSLQACMVPAMSRRRDTTGLTRKPGPILPQSWASPFLLAGALHHHRLQPNLRQLRSCSHRKRARIQTGSVSGPWGRAVPARGYLCGAEKQAPLAALDKPSSSTASLLAARAGLRRLWLSQGGSS